MTKTVVIGASPNPRRYAYQAVQALNQYGIEAIPIGIRKGKTANDIQIVNGQPSIEDVHTVTLYISPDIQDLYYDYILDVLQPKRIIFNPGTENPEFYKKIKEKAPQTEIEIACTLVMLSVGNYAE